MDRITFIHPPRENAAHGRRAILLSFGFHVMMLTFLLAAAVYFRSQALPPSGSAPGASLTLQVMVVDAPPTDPPPTPTTILTPTISPPLPDAAKPELSPMAPTKLPEVGVPVLPLHLAQRAQPKSHAAHKDSPPAEAKPAAAPVASSYSPGAPNLPHPPYPPEARKRGLSGTVVVSITFDSAGDVARTAVVESSGIDLLDTETEVFFRRRLHLAHYAGQTITQPVEYSLVNH